jgi:hypothetical protein
VAVEVALADEPVDGLDAWPVGEGVRVPVPGDPPPEQAETVSARRTAPAAERPAISHAPGAATGGVRRSFMNPPRMRVR